MSPDLRRFLDEAGARYELLRHPLAFTAQHRAATAHIPGRHIAKVVMVRSGDWFGMAVLPAPVSLDIFALAGLSKRRRLRLAAENEFVHLFPDCEPGAMPPFGRFYGIDVFLDRDLADADEIVAPAGSHGEEMCMTVSEYIRVAQPAIGTLSTTSRAA
jgi:Ala-tRNA(Pro) deacylase